jgi:galactokinase
LAELQQEFQKQFGKPPELTVRAPGRVNLIGEHTDYNEGFVFPAAIDRVMNIAASPVDGKTVTVYSLDYRQKDSFSLDAIEKSQYGWANYLRGVLKIMRDAGHKVTAFNAVISGDVPQGAGLSSSAAYEVAVARLVSTMGSIGLSGKNIALLSQRAENQFVGVQCGIMDQFISALAERDSALLIDCRNLEYRAVKLNLEARGVSIVITNSGVQRGLVDSEYNARRNECAEGVRLLGELSGHPIHSLRDVSLSDLDEFSTQLPEVVARRCHHVVSENHRVLAAVEKLEQGHLRSLGKLMNESHASLRDDYQVSTPEVDLLVNLTQNHPGTLGARMTGAGFGGCTVAIMETTTVDEFVKNVLPLYEKQTGRKPEVYVCTAVDGASVN